MSPLLAISLLAAAVVQDGVSVTVTAEPPVIPFHRQTHLTVSVEATGDVEVKLPELSDFGGLNLYAPPELKKEALGGDRIRFAQVYTLDPIFAGNYRLPPVTVEVGEGEPITVPSPAIRVRDLTGPETEAAMRFAPNALPKDPKDGLLEQPAFWVVLALVVLGVVLVVVWAGRRRKEGPAVARIAPPWEVAYARLRELDARQWPKLGRFGPYYVVLSDILRHYTEDRFTLHAPEQTTPEFLAEASSSGAFGADHQKLLARFLRHCDRVKFARYQPSLKEMEWSFAEVLRFIDETTPKEESPEDEAA
jgi:hypothetical protein